MEKYAHIEPTVKLDMMPIAALLNKHSAIKILFCSADFTTAVHEILEKHKLGNSSGLAVDLASALSSTEI